MRTLFESTSTGCFPRLLRTHSNSVNPRFFFQGCKSVPGGVESQASLPLQQHPPLPSRPGSYLEELPFSFLSPHKHLTLIIFVKRARKVIVTGNTKTTKGWASEREKYRSVAVVDCRAQAVYSCGLPICFIYCWTSLVCRFFV